MTIHLLLAATAVAVLGAGGTAAAQNVACGPGHLATIEADGTVSAGTKEALRRAAALGQPLRIGWMLDPDGDGLADVSHWSDGGFVSAFEGEVFVQIDDIQRQQPLRGQRRIALPQGRQRWSAILGTTGTLEGHFDDGSTPTTTRVRSTWCIDPRAVSCAPQWRLVYRHDADGAPIEGNRQALLDAVRRGAPVRVAWGFSGTAGTTPITVEHTADPVFLSIMEGQHVFIQLPEHIAQASYYQPGQARFDQPSVMWRGLMGSDGTFDAVMTDRATGAEVRRLPQRAGLAWFAEIAPPGCAQPAPLQLAVPGGVRPVRPAP
jgi:hypothetical protein